METFEFGPNALEVMLRIAVASEERNNKLDLIISELENLNTKSNTRNELLSNINDKFQFLNDRASNENLGIYVNDRIYDDEETRMRIKAGYAAFDNAMDETQNVQAVKNRIKNPIDWDVN